ncbi:MAG: hypothetical protein ACK53Y_09705, partial [bacterium]
AMYVPRYIANTPLGYTHRSDRTVTTTYPLLERRQTKNLLFHIDSTLRATEVSQYVLRYEWGYKTGMDRTFKRSTRSTLVL